MLTKCFRDTLDYLPSNDHTLGEKKTSLFFFFFSQNVRYTLRVFWQTEVFFLANLQARKIIRI